MQFRSGIDQFLHPPAEDRIIFDDPKPDLLVF
jgi:hypothetical protein